MADALVSPAPLQLRAELEAMVRRDLLGPAGGPAEELDERAVRGRYILGLLAPRGQTILPDDQDDLPAGGADTEQDGRADPAAVQTVSMLPSAIGLSFNVDLAAEAIAVTARWGHYRCAVSETLTDDKGDPRRVWKRQQIEATTSFPLATGQLGPWVPIPDGPEVYVRGICRKRDTAWSVTLFLINAQHEPKEFKDEAWVFQPELVVAAPGGAAIFVKRQLPAALNTSSPEDRAMEMLYRRHVEFAVGHGVAVHAEILHSVQNDKCGGWERAVALRTEVMPTYEVERMEPPDPADVPPLAQAVLDMADLAALQSGQFASALAPLAAAYEGWIAAQEARLADPAPDLLPFTAEASQNLAACRAALARIGEGIALLDRDPRAALAFVFANRAMHMQRVRSIYTRLVRQSKPADPSASSGQALATLDVPANRTWRPFQLAFILINLPSLADPAHRERTEMEHLGADLLWFPTGGGKTEAYLGLAAFAMGIRRLQGELGGLSGAAGVTVLMRYTLRLLTLQQFQRAAALICACELLRQGDPGRWGDEPFRIGLWVGQRSTPNWTKDSAEAVKQAHNLGWGGGGTPHQLTNCPWCGKPIHPGQNIQVETVEAGHGHTFQYCSDPLGQCPFSFRQSPGEGIPIVVVDEEIYRRLPSLLIATVDKFAQMPWKGATAMLFGRVNGLCPRHGFRSPEIEDSDSHPKRDAFPAVKTQPIGSLRPPDLIIQDELHLISGPLGTLVGLYETAVDELCAWNLDGRRVRPKILASTATIRRAREQVHNVFLRRVAVFPPPGLDADDSFFARRAASTIATPGRLYLGLCGPGTRLKTVLIRTYAAFMSAAQVLYEKYGAAADPWMTLVGYFNAMRELGGMRRMVEDAIRTRLEHMDQRGLARRYIHPFSVEELTSRKDATDIPAILDRLEVIFDPQDTAERKRKRGMDAPKGSVARWPLDVVLATNMISVGVDVNRLGLMVVAGQPKATAEYIQATSRVGRAFPGIVCTVYNWARPRDLSHYERFAHYHATFYRQVEALSVTPFSPRALDRGLTGVLAALVRLPGDDFNANAGAGRVERQHTTIHQAREAIRRRAGAVQGSVADEALVDEMVQQRIDEWLSRAGAVTGGAILGYEPRKDGRTRGLLRQPTDLGRDLFTCLNSLRDVEPTVALVLRDHGMDWEPGHGPGGEEVAS
jgi:hypothetical protein